VSYVKAEAQMLFQYRVITSFSLCYADLFANGTTGIQNCGTYIANYLPLLSSAQYFNNCYEYAGEQWMHTIVSMNQTITVAFNESNIVKGILLGAGAVALVQGLRHYMNAGAVAADVVEPPPAQDEPEDRLERLTIKKRVKW